MEARRDRQALRALRAHLGRARRDQLLPGDDPAIDAFDPARPELLELADGDDASRRTSPSRPGDPVDAWDGSLVDTRDGSAVDERDASVVSRVDALQAGRLCAWCNDPIPTVSHSGRRTRADAETCGVICRKRRNRFLRAVRDGAPARQAQPPRRRVPSRRRARALSPMPIRPTPAARTTTTSARRSTTPR